MINKISFLAFLTVTLYVSVASAVIITERSYLGTAIYSGDYMFTVTDPKSDTVSNMALIETSVEAWFLSKKSVDRDVTFTFYDKVDAFNSTSTSNEMVVTYESGGLSGLWSTDDPIEFYTVKSATEFALYWMGDTGSESGFWSTGHLLGGGGVQPEISHLSTWNEVSGGGPGPGGDPIPEPSTWLLLGSGLVGLAFWRRKQL